MSEDLKVGETTRTPRELGLSSARPHYVVDKHGHSWKWEDGRGYVLWSLQLPIPLGDK